MMIMPGPYFVCSVVITIINKIPTIKYYLPRNKINKIKQITIIIYLVELYKTQTTEEL